jgi:hypothetical protein
MHLLQLVVHMDNQQAMRHMDNHNSNSNHSSHMDNQRLFSNHCNSSPMGSQCPLSRNNSNNSLMVIISRLSSNILHHQLILPLYGNHRPPNSISDLSYQPIKYPVIISSPPNHK